MADRGGENGDVPNPALFYDTNGFRSLLGYDTSHTHPLDLFQYKGFDGGLRLSSLWRPAHFFSRDVYVNHEYFLNIKNLGTRGAAGRLRFAGGPGPALLTGTIEVTGEEIDFELFTGASGSLRRWLLPRRRLY